MIHSIDSKSQISLAVELESSSVSVKEAKDKLIYAILAHETATQLTSATHKLSLKSSGGDDTPPNFNSDPGLPTNASPNESNQQIRSTFLEWLDYIRTHPLNFEALQKFMEWIKSEAEVNGSKPALQEILKELSTNFNGSGESFAQFYLEALRDNAFFNYSGPDRIAYIEAQMAKFKKEFDDLAKTTNDPFFKQLAYFADEEDANILAWANANGGNGTTTFSPSEWQNQFNEMMLNFLVGNDSLKKMRHAIYMEYVNSYVKEFKDNPALLMSLIFGTVGRAMNDDILSLSQEGDTNKLLAYINSLLANIENTFNGAQSAKSLSGAELKKLFTQIATLLQVVQSLAKILGPTIVSQTSSAFSQLLNTSITFDGKTVTFKQLLSENLTDNDWDVIAAEAKEQNIFWQPGSSNTPAGPTQLTNNLIQSMQTTAQTYSGQQQSVSVQMQELNQMIQSFENLLSTIIKYYSDNWNGQLVKNQIVT